MAAITVGSVEVDIIPNSRGIYGRLQSSLIPAASRVGDEAGRVIGRHVSTQIAQAVRDGVTDGGRTAAAPAARQGQQTGSAFARSFKGRVEAALRDLPDVRIDADSSAADREIAQIRAQLMALRDTTVGVDIDAGEASARIARLQAQLQRLQSSDADVSVRMDVGAASAQLAAFQAQLNQLDGRDVNVRVDPVVRSFGMLTTAAAAFGPAILPAIPVVAAGLGAVAAAAVAAGAGIGSIGLVAIPAFKQIGTVLQAQKAAQDAASQATAAGGQAAAQASSKAMQLAAAQAAVASAERSGARQIAQAQAAVSQARRNAAQVAAQASQRAQEAARAVQDAEEALADAQRDARRAQEDLTQARRTAALELEDLNNRLTDSVLSQRDAEIQLQEATAERDAVLKNAKSSELDRRKAILQYDQAVQRLKEQTTQTARLKDETAAANKAGVNGTETVRSAQQRLADAQEQVRERTTDLRDAQADQARTAIQNAQDLAEAQRRIGEAQANVANAQQQAAEGAAAAQRQLAQAQQQSVGGANAAASAQAKYQAELAKLTPSARGTLNAFLDLRTAFSAWSRSLQPHVMPIFTRALEGMRRSLPGLTPFVKAAAAAISDLQDRVSRGFKSPWWKEFKADLAGAVRPAITGLGVAFGNVFRGMAGVVQAFLPHMDSISTRMQTITARFAAWGTSLKGSPAFERFLSYSSEQAPLLAEALGSLFGALLHLGVALAPLGSTATSFINALATGISSIPTSVLTTVGVAFASIAIGAKLAAVAIGIWKAAQAAATIATAVLTGHTWALNAAMRANLIGAIVTALMALVVAIVYAYQNSERFRSIVQGAWRGIQTVVSAVWNGALKPVFTALVSGLQAIGRWAVWLWRTVLAPAFSGISLAARILATLVLTVLITPLVLAFQALAAVAKWLWQTAIQPAFSRIGALAVWLWNKGVKPALSQLRTGLRLVGAAASWLYQRAVRPAFDGIGSAISTAWTKAIRPAFNAIRSAIQTVLGPVFRTLRDKVVKPVWSAIRSAISAAWDKGIRPAFNALKTATGRVADAFRTAKDGIKRAWDKVKDIAKAPVRFVIDTVYNGGIVKVWNKVADAFGAPELKEFHPKGFASGGVLPGYTPGRDVHRFVSPTGGALDLSGGEAIMRPEFTRAVGSGFVGTMNAIAKSRGAQGVKAALAPVFGGNPPSPTDRSLKYASGGVHQAFADGGIFGWIGKGANAVAGAGSAAWNKVKEGAAWLKDTLEASARAGVEHVVDPILRNFPGMDTGIGKMLRRIPTKIIDALFGYTEKADKRGGGGGVGGPRIKKALNWAKTQHGKPYQWAGNGNPSWDCSGFLSAIESVIRGQKPHRRWATMAFNGKQAPPGWVYHGNSAFRVGITNAGVGHTAGTLGKTNVESRGGDGVLVGKRARGYSSSMFGHSWYGFQPGKYDNGGMLQPGFNLAYNGTGRPEPVLTGAQFNDLAHGRPSSEPIVVELHTRDSVLADFIDIRVRDHDATLVQVLSAG